MVKGLRPGSVVFPADLEAFCVRAMCKAGLSEPDAQQSAEVLVTTDTWGVHTHGTKQLRPLLSNVRAGRLSAQARPEVVRQGPGWALVDGHYAMPMVTSRLAMQTAIAKARACGVGYVGVFHSSHFGAAGFYAVLATRQDMIGLAMCNVDPCMTVPGGRGKILGTNPIAFAVPAGEEEPVFLDIATSAVAASKVFAARFLGKKIPDTWLVDDDGVPTTDPSIYPESGALLPMAGHKGYGLALLVEILAAALTGAAMTQGVASWLAGGPEVTNQGHAFIAIDAGAIMPIRQFKARIDGLVREIRAAPKARGCERIYLPGEMEWERRQRALERGMVLPDDAVANLNGLAEDWGIDIGVLGRANT